MRIAFLYGKFSLGPRPLDFDTLYTSPRGLTGSELSCVEYAHAMKQRGHEVILVVGHLDKRTTWRGIDVFPLKDPNVVAGFDVVYSWNEPDLLREIPTVGLRIVNQQLNDFAYCQPGWEEFSDVVTSPSAHHLEFLRKMAPNVRRWDVVPNGCDPTQYAEVKRVPGRVIWASSADRGLHLLLQAWPQIKTRVPDASLRCFYNFQPAHFDEFESVGPNVHPDLLEIAQRKRYIQYAMGKLAGPKWDVEHVGSVSRERMREEFERAVVLGYPCDPIRYTEGFSVTSMEACASGCLPVLTDVDSLGHIYGGAVPMVSLAGKSFGPEHTKEFVDLVVRGLTNEPWRRIRVAECKQLAAQHAWPVLAERLEKMLVERLKEKASAPRQTLKVEKKQSHADVSAAAET